jgi:dCMP deaminase
MTMAYELAKRSHDCQTQHGCVIINDRKQVLGTGYNGFIKGIDDSQLPNTRPDKYPWMIHSEINALLNCEHRPVGATAYVTGHPCLHCYQCMYQAGIAVIIYDAAPERNAVMIDEAMMDNIKKLEGLIANRILKVPYYYKMEEAFELGKKELDNFSNMIQHINISTDLGREEILELGRRQTYHSYPIEIKPISFNTPPIIGDVTETIIETDPT